MEFHINCCRNLSSSFIYIYVKCAQEREKKISPNKSEIKEDDNTNLLKEIYSIAVRQHETRRHQRRKRQQGLAPEEEKTKASNNTGQGKPQLSWPPCKVPRSSASDEAVANKNEPKKGHQKNSRNQK